MMRFAKINFSKSIVRHACLGLILPGSTNDTKQGKVDVADVVRRYAYKWLDLIRKPKKQKLFIADRKMRGATTKSDSHSSHATVTARENLLQIEKPQNSLENVENQSVFKFAKKLREPRKYPTSWLESTAPPPPVTAGQNESNPTDPQQAHLERIILAQEILEFVSTARGL